jgi:xanthine dehydrogenase accessory factor
MGSARRRVLVRGAGDIGSAVAVHLFQAGHAVAIHEGQQPTTSRRGMAFADAVFDGEAMLEGIKAVKVTTLQGLRDVLGAREVIPVVVADVTEALAAMEPHVLVDARVRKRTLPEIQRALAPLTIGLGPNFTAGTTTDIVVETSWEDLGRVITVGTALPFRGEPREIAGHARDRYVYAKEDGIFRTKYRIGDRVVAGHVVAQIGETALTAPLDGVLRGLTRDGVPVPAGTKVIEVDPRGQPDLVLGIGERASRIAAGVIRVIEDRAADA